MKILVSDNLASEGIAILEQSSFTVDVNTALQPRELMQKIPQYDALVVRSKTKVTEEVIAAGVKLKVIGRAGVGVDNIDVEAATKRGILVLNAPEGNTVAATEHTLAMMLALARNIPQADQSMKDGHWEKSRFMGVELRGKVLGILGLGRIGSGVAKRALAMEMKVLAYDPFISEEHARDLGVEAADLETVLANADFITLHLPVTPETRNLINEQSLNRMKRGVRIVNCARGGIINEHDLAKALREGRVAGAALDVFGQEPIEKANPLLGLPNVVLTPHLGASTAEAQVNVAIDVAKGVVAALRGEPVTTAVNIAPIPAHILPVIKPYLTLAEKMGCLAIHLADGPVQRLEAEFTGEIGNEGRRALTIAALKGLLNSILQEPVNYVNAPVIARARGIKVREVKVEEAESFANLLRLRVFTAHRELTVSGTLFGRKEARIVEINGYRVDVAPQGWLLISPHIDRPGMVGAVGTILGEAGINIAGMQVGRTERIGTNIMVMSVEADVPAPVMQKIAGIDGIFEAKLVNFNAC